MILRYHSSCRRWRPLSVTDITPQGNGWVPSVLLRALALFRPAAPGRLTRNIPPPARTSRRLSEGGTDPLFPHHCVCYWIFIITWIRYLSRRNKPEGVSNHAVKGSQKEKRGQKCRGVWNDSGAFETRIGYRPVRKQLRQPEDFPAFAENTSAACQRGYNCTDQH